MIIHPGPVGDRGPSSLDWAITEGARAWGVTALQAVEEMDAGPIWATRTFPLPAAPPRKSSLYNGPVADAAMECIFEVVAKAADPASPRSRPTAPDRGAGRPAAAADAAGGPGVRLDRADRAHRAPDPGRRRLPGRAHRGRRRWRCSPTTRTRAWPAAAARAS